MAGIALKHGATLDKYVGDAIIAFFGDPETRGVADDAKACVTMAIEMQQRIAELDSQWQADGFEHPFRVRMGINTGFCTVGNFGSQDRMDYTIIGGAVNLAARLESAADPGKILIARETWSLVKDGVIANEMSPLTVKGIGQPVQVYELLGLKDSMPQKVIRRSIDGVQITIELNRSDKEQTVQVLKDLIAEIDFDRKAI
jgi:class 3 adenylate cyclase